MSEIITLKRSEIEGRIKDLEILNENSSSVDYCSAIKELKFLLQKKQSHSYNGKVFEVPTLTDIGGIHYYPLNNTEERILDSRHRIFDLYHFGIARKPVVISEIPHHVPGDLMESFRILDMPIKFPESIVRIPKECVRYNSIIEKIMQTERLLNPDYSRYFAYLTIDYSEVEKGKSQRNGGYHVDGFQGARINPKVVADRSYVVVSDFPPVFCVQAWNVKKLNPAKDNFFLEFDRQAEKKNEWSPNPWEIILMDAYMVHKAGIATVTRKRMFFRISFSVREFDRLGNTHNPMFNYNWKMVERDISKELK